MFLKLERYVEFAKVMYKTMSVPFFLDTVYIMPQIPQPLYKSHRYCTRSWFGRSAYRIIQYIMHYISESLNYLHFLNDSIISQPTYYKFITYNVTSNLTSARSLRAWKPSAHCSWKMITRQRYNVATSFG